MISPEILENAVSFDTVRVLEFGGNVHKIIIHYKVPCKFLGQTLFSIPWCKVLQYTSEYGSSSRPEERYYWDLKFIQEYFVKKWVN